MTYRDRVYTNYTTGSQRSRAPASLEGLRIRAPYLNHVIRTHFPSNREATIIDLGCGYGAFVHLLHEAGYHNVTGIDLSPEQVAAARDLGISGVQEGDLMETLRALPEGSQDVVIAFDVLEHFTKEELFLFADEVFRVLSPGGKWIIHTLNGESPFGFRVFAGDLSHETPFTQKSMTQLVRAAGFAEVECQETVLVVHSLKTSIRFILWKVTRFILHLWLSAEIGRPTNSPLLTQNFLTVAVKL